MESQPQRSTRRKPTARAGARAPARSQRILRVLGLVALGLFIVGGATGLGFVISAWRQMPALTSVEPKVMATSFLYDKDGQLVTGLIGPENRVPVELSQIPEHVQKAFIAQEDKYFYTHHGFVLRSILRAVYSDVTGGEIQGGSTITQQLARTAFLSLERTMKRKVQEVILAVQMERTFTKPEILEMYLNQIPLGHGGYGVEVAAQNYFGKHVWELDLAQAALIAGVPKSPTRFSPYVNPDLAKRQQQLVLSKMVGVGYISRQEADAAAAEELVFPGLPSRASYPYPFFVDYVLDQLLNVYQLDHDLVYSGGLKIYTTLDQKAQTAAEQAVAKYQPEFPHNDKGESAECGVVVMENETGCLRAIVGGIEHTQKLQYNFATQSKRQPGSAFKPIVDYTPAVDLGYGPLTVVDDAPFVLFTLTGESYMPGNHNDVFMGLVNFRTALERSINTCAARVLNMIGIRTGIDYAQRMGIENLVTQGLQNDVTHSLALGALTYGVSPLELNRAYAVLGNRGVKVLPLAVLRVEDRAGRVLMENQPRREVVLSEQTAWLVTNMLVGVIESEQGTGRRAKLEGWMAAGKTGTSQDYADAWFAGYTAKHSCTVWIGYPKDRASMGVFFGGVYPAYIWKESMTAAQLDMEPVEFEMPKDIVEVTVCRKSGKLPGASCPAADLTSDFCLRGAEPKETCDRHTTAHICLGDPGRLAGPYCPPEVTAYRTFIRRQPYVPWVTEEGVALVPRDAGQEEPREYCRLHQAVEPFIPDKVVEVTMANGRFNPSTITVAAGQKVRLVLHAVGRLYGLAIEDYCVSAVCPAGMTVNLDFVASKQGTFNYFCHADIGDERPKMVGQLIVN